MIRCNVIRHTRKRFKRILRQSFVQMLNSYRWTLMFNLIPRRSQLVGKLNQYESQTMVQLKGKIKILFSTKVIQICYK